MDKFEMDRLKSFQKIRKLGVKVGSKIKITYMLGENEKYGGKVGIVKKIDDIGQLHGTWGGLAISPTVDEFELIK